MKRISHGKSVKSKSVSFIGHCETPALCRTGKKFRKITASITVRSSSGMIRNKVCGLHQTVATGGYGKEMGFGNCKNKSRLSVSTAQVQTPAAVAGGDALAGRVLERPPQRKMRQALSEKLARWVCDRRNKKEVSGCTQWQHGNTWRLKDKGIWILRLGLMRCGIQGGQLHFFTAWKLKGEQGAIKWWRCH